MRGGFFGFFSGETFLISQHIVPDFWTDASQDGAHPDGQGGERQADGQGHAEVVACGHLVPADVAPHLQRREGEEGALDLAHADADHRKAGSNDLRLPVEDTLQQLPERHLHDLREFLLLFLVRLC